MWFGEVTFLIRNAAGSRRGPVGGGARGVAVVALVPTGG